jgi:hypothetical protein
VQGHKTGAHRLALLLGRLACALRLSRALVELLPGLRAQLAPPFGDGGGHERRGLGLWEVCAAVPGPLDARVLLAEEDVVTRQGPLGDAHKLAPTLGAPLGFSRHVALDVGPQAVVLHLVGVALEVLLGLRLERGPRLGVRVPPLATHGLDQVAKAQPCPCVLVQLKARLLEENVVCVRRQQRHGVN